MSAPRVAVVGGGIAGLAAAYTAAQAGLDVTVLEAGDTWGGKVRTRREAGFVVERGPDSVITYKPAALQWMRELGLDDEIISMLEPRSVFLRRDGRMIPIPEGMGLVLPTQLGPFARTRLFTWRQKMRAGLDLVLPRQLEAGEDEAIGEFLGARLGRGIVERLADPLLGGVYGAAVDELSIDAVLPQLRTYEDDHRSLILAGLRSARGRAPAPPPFRSLALGMGRLVDRAVEVLQDGGRVDLRTGARVEGASVSGGVTRLTTAGGGEVDVEAVVWAAPAPSIAGVLGLVSGAAGDVGAGLPMGSTAVVSLAYDEEAFDEPPVGHGFLEAGPQRAVFSGVTISSGKWAGRAPAGYVLLRTFLPARSVSLARHNDETVVAVVHRQLAPIMGVRRGPDRFWVDRWIDSMPQYRPGHLAMTASMTALVEQVPGWTVAGSSYRGVGVPDCVASGRAAAEHVIRLGA